MAISNGYRRNGDLHTSAEQAQANIVERLRREGPGRSLPLSTLAEAAFPGYRFASAQGAALSVARLVRGLQESGVLAPAPRGVCGYRLR